MIRRRSHQVTLPNIFNPLQQSFVALYFNDIPANSQFMSFYHKIIHTTPNPKPVSSQPQFPSMQLISTTEFTCSLSHLTFLQLALENSCHNLTSTASIPLTVSVVATYTIFLLKTEPRVF